jgi:hypothetical protein
MMLTCDVSRYQQGDTIQGQLLLDSVNLSSYGVTPSSDGSGFRVFFAGFPPLTVCHDTDCCCHVLLFEDEACVAQNCFRSGKNKMNLLSVPLDIRTKESPLGGVPE